MRQLKTTLKTVSFVAFLLIASKSFSQISVNSSLTDTSQYYQQSWKTNVDSLDKSWIGQKISPPYFGLITTIFNPKTFEMFGLKQNEKTEELIRFYQSDKPKTQKAIALYVKYLPIFRSALKEQNLPEELSALTLALTAMHNEARGFTGGAGLWQLSYSVGLRENLIIESYVDERLDIEKSSKAAASHLAVLYSIYKDWKLTIAAYVCGPSNLNKAMRRNGNVTDYYTIKSSLPWFGKDAVDAFAATLLLLELQDQLLQVNYLFNTDTIEVSERIHFVQLRDMLDIDMNELRYLNPAYKYDIIPAVHKIYNIVVPMGKLKLFNELEDSIYKYNDSVLFRIQPKIASAPIIVEQEKEAEVVEPVIPKNREVVYYSVKSGDNLGMIAIWFDVKVSELQDWNSISDPTRIQVGKKLKVYVPKNQVDYYKKIDKLTADQKNSLKGPGSATTTTTANTSQPKVEKGEYIIYTVQSGESPYTIAKKFPGVSAEDILRWNNITDATKINVGQKLKIKKNP